MLSIAATKLFKENFKHKAKLIVKIHSLKNNLKKNLNFLLKIIKNKL